jgi:hypothetical protein
MKLLGPNQEALEARYPELARQMRSEPETDPVTVRPAASGSPTALIDGIHLHSSYDPARDAAQQVQRELGESASCIVVLGFGLGYGAEAARSRFPDRPLLIVEPAPAVFRAALCSRDLSTLISDPGVTLYVNAEPEGLAMVLEKLPLASPGFLRLRAGFQARPAAYRAAEETLQSWMLRRDININTLQRFGKLWVRNLTHNMRAFIDCPGVSTLEGAFDGIPALVVAGGPTLDAIAPHLPALRERMLVISVGTPLKACVQWGAPPDIAVVVDPQYWASRFLDWTTLPRGVLVAEPSTYPRAFRAVDAPFFLCSSLFPLGETLEASVGVKGQLGAGGSVATSAWDLARLLGASPLYAAGLDLGFPGMRTHCRGVYTEEIWFASGSRLSPVELSSFRSVRDIGLFLTRSTGGGLTHTDRRMLLYKWWFENQLRMRPDLAAYTLSPDGTAIDGMPLARIDEVLALPLRREEIDRRMGGVRQMHTSRERAALDGQRLRAALKELQSQLAEMESLALQGVDLSRRLRGIVGSSGDPDSCLRAMDQIDAKILSLSARNIAGFLIQSVIHGISDQGDRAVSADEVVFRSTSIYQGIADSAGLQRSLLARSGSVLSEVAE